MWNLVLAMSKLTCFSKVFILNMMSRILDAVLLLKPGIASEFKSMATNFSTLSGCEEKAYNKSVLNVSFANG